MKHKISDLEGALLDAAVGLAENAKPRKVLTSVTFDEDTPATFRLEHLRYSRSWQHGGPIIEREQISIVACEIDGLEPWSASVGAYVYRFLDEELPIGSVGPTPLIAAMRAYCASKFGDEVELT